MARDPDYLRLVLAWCCTWFALGALQSSFVLANDLRLGWGARENGLALAGVGVGSALVQGVLTRLIIPRTGERLAALGGYALACGSYVLFGLADHAWILFLGIALQSVSSISARPSRPWSRRAPRRTSRVPCRALWRRSRD